MLKMPNAKKRVQAIIEIKKVIQSKVNQIGLMSAVKDLIEPFLSPGSRNEGLKYK